MRCMIVYNYTCLLYTSIYAGIGDVAQMIRQESEALLRKDASPDTGDHFNPKTAGVILLFSIGMLLLLYRRKPIVK